MGGHGEVPALAGATIDCHLPTGKFSIRAFDAKRNLAADLLKIINISRADHDILLPLGSNQQVRRERASLTASTRTDPAAFLASIRQQSDRES